MLRVLGWLVTWEGRVSRAQYVLAGAILVIIKYGIDRSIAAHFGEQWQIWNYVLPVRDLSIFGLGAHKPQMYGMLWAVAIPFFWFGTSLTLRRLRDSGIQRGWIALFFIPIANLLLFLWLSIAPTRPAVELPEHTPSDSLPDGRRTAVIGIFLAVTLGVALVALSTDMLKSYGWGLFLGVPFLIGFVSSWFLNARGLRPIHQTITISVVATIMVGVALLGFRFEGLICLLMALPLSVPFAIGGALLASQMLSCRRKPSAPTFASWIFILPVLMFAEHAAKLEPPVLAVTTSITIEAPVNVVWNHVVSFAPLAEPDELIFRTGIAYPTSATIVGKGPGAMRYCRFSTGDFVEPITVWDENHLLAFNVTSQPPAMRELSPWKISPPHLKQDYMRSRHGQFRLTAVGPNRTLLEGTTWYQNYFWPQPYWQLWSDNIVHQIHARVLRHVKQQSEGAREAQ